MYRIHRYFEQRSQRQENHKQTKNSMSHPEKRDYQEQKLERHPVDSLDLHEVSDDETHHSNVNNPQAKAMSNRFGAGRKGKLRHPLTFKSGLNLGLTVGATDPRTARAVDKLVEVTNPGEKSIRGLENSVDLVLFRISLSNSSIELEDMMEYCQYYLLKDWVYHSGVYMRV